MIAFADDVQYPDDPCYSEGLSLATSANSEKLKNFTQRIHPSKSSANYSKAFTEAFRLLTPVDTGNNSDSVTTNTRRGMKLSSQANDNIELSGSITGM